MDKRKASGLYWPLAYLAGIGLAVMIAAGRTGGLAPIWLAIGLPGAMAISPSVRRQAGFPLWILSIVPLALYGWAKSAGFLEQPLVTPLWIIGAVAAALLVWIGLQRREVNLGLWLLMGLVILVSYFSSGQGSANPMMEWLTGHGLTPEQAHAVTLAFRKTIHFTFYGTVAVSAFRSVLRSNGLWPEAIRTGLLAALALASFDEFRQGGYANRSGSPWDVLLDMTGGLVFLGLLQWRHHRRR